VTIEQRNMTNIRLKLRIILPFVVGGVILFAMFLFGSYREQNNNIDRQVADNLQTIEQIYQTLLQEHTEQLESALELVAADRRITQALRRQDRKALLKAAAPLFERLQSRHHITRLAFHDATRTNLVRLHDPGRSGDRVNTLNVLDAMESGKAAHGVEVDSAGKLVLRAVLPIRLNRRLRGYVEVGKELDELFRQVAWWSSMSGWPNRNWIAPFGKSDSAPERPFPDGSSTPAWYWRFRPGRCFPGGRRRG